ncbi:MAG: hypothetical protein EHM20_16655 [Alphaproteobacteria bacterium]|nr:MAG: hypothetical protein EHM20_16655 [Alphaproteobacteria bacterium]
MDIPVYKSTRYEYIRIGDLKEEHERLELNRWIFGQIQPLIQGEGKGVPATLDAVFLDDYKRFLKHKDGKLPLDSETKV